MLAGRLGSVRTRARVLAVVASIVTGVFVVNAGVASAMPVRPAQISAPVPSAGHAVQVTPVLPHTSAKVPAATYTSFTPSPAKTKWPSPATGTLALSATAHAGAAGAKSVAAGTPVWAQTLASSSGSYAGPSAVKVAVKSKALAAELGISGVVWSLAAAGTGRGDVRVGLDYSSFSEAIGGNYASRLRLVELPECALTTPQLARCRVQTPLTSVNTPASSSVSAVVGLGSATASATSGAPASSKAAIANAASASDTSVLGATDSTGQEGGEGGTYASDQLSSAGSWAQSGSSGDYTYTYKVTLPSSSSSLTPDASLSYDSGEVNGKTSNTQAQSSWVGDGWETQDSYIEQSFIPCDDDPEGAAGTVTTTDECYNGQILTLSLNGTSTSIVDDAGTYKLQDDDGAVLTKVTGSGNGSSTFDTSYWKVTERDGTTYYFGLNALPGWATPDAPTNSVDFERVYSAHNPATGTYTDPCYNATATASCWADDENMMKRSFRCESSRPRRLYP